MATAKSIALRREAAMARIQEAAATLSNHYDVGDWDLDPPGRDAGQRYAAQMENIAGLLEDLAGAAAPQPETETAAPAKPRSRSRSSK